MKQIQIIGHLGRDAKKVSGNGSEFLSFSVGVSEKWKNANGEVQERTDWFSVTTKQVNIQQWLVKGMQVFVQGSLKTSIYRNETTSMNHVDLAVNATTIQLLGSANSGGSQVAGGAPLSSAPPTASGNGNDDDLPF